MALQSKWFIGIKDKESWEAYVRNSSDLLQHLTRVVKQEIESLEVPTDYDSPNWAYKMADHQGQLRALRNVLKLVELK